MVIRKKLSNGIPVLFGSCPGQSVTITVDVSVGSLYETAANNGISHFTEHMLFEGTTHRTTFELSNAIEKLGGVFNAGTSRENTSYYVKLPIKHASVGISILSDMIHNPLFDSKLIEKEKNVVLEEIAMVFDEPRYYQWVLLYKHLFKGTLSQPVYGLKNVVSNLTDEDFKTFHNEYYVASRLTLVVSGNVDPDVLLPLLEEHFGTLKDTQTSSLALEHQDAKSELVFEKRDIVQQYVVMGVRIPPLGSKEGYAFELIDAVLARGQSGKLFDEIRNKRGLAYELGTYLDLAKYYGMYALYYSCQPDTVIKIRDLILGELKALTQLSEEDLADAKSYFEGNFLLDHEDSQKYGELLCDLSQVNSELTPELYVASVLECDLGTVRTVAEQFLKDFTIVTLGKEQIL